MSKETCSPWPEISVNGKTEISRLGFDLISKEGENLPREIALMLYSEYRCSNTAQLMDAAVNPDGSKKYTKNRQGEFDAKDLLDFLEFDKAMAEINTMSEEEARLGFTEGVGGKRVDFKDAEEALRKADDFNSTHKGLVATVRKHSTTSGNIYNIEVSERNANTIDWNIPIREKLQAWEIYKEAFNEKGIDITNLPSELKDIFNANNEFLAQRLLDLQNTAMDSLYKKDIITLFSLSSDSIHIQRAVNAFGSIEEAAQAVDNFNHGINTITDAQKHLLKRAIIEAKKFHDVDVETLNNKVRKLIDNIIANSTEIEIKKDARVQRRKYKVYKETAERINDDIESLSDSVEEAIITLNRKLAEYYKTRGNITEGRNLEDILNKLEKELASMKYYSGMVDFLAQASTDILSIDSLINSIPSTGTERDKIFKTAKVLKDIQDINDQYGAIVAALANENITIDEDINQEDIDILRQEATKLNDFLNKNQKVVKELTKLNAKAFLRYSTGGKLTEAEINTAIEMAATDASWGDQWLYSMGRASNLLISSTGSLIQDAKRETSQAMNNISRQIARADDRLKKSGHDSKYIYEDQTHIISDIDWNSYIKAKEKHRNSLIKKGLSRIEIKQALEDWEDQNTEAREVDHKNHRYERVPNGNYRKTEDFQKDWDDAMKEYYNTMLELKGELETLLPTNAQNIYLPPQVRRGTWEALGNAENGQDVRTALWNKFSNLWTVREDDTDFIKNGVITDENAISIQGDYDNTPKRSVPIYYQNPVEEGELLLDFSTGLTRYAKSALNYSAMEDIRVVCEFMRDFADSQNAAAVGHGKSLKEVVDTKEVQVLKTLYNKAKKTNVSTVMTGFIDQYIYDIKKNQNNPRVTKFFDNIIRYTSFKGLVTNVPGAVANGLVGVNQILTDAGCGEFFGFKDIAWAATKLFGKAGTTGEVMDFLTNNKTSKAALMREIFDPLQENLSDKGSKKYHNNLFMQLVSKDLSFIGYGSGEYLIHMLPMYAILHRNKVLYNGEKISLWDAYEETAKVDGNSELKIKEGVTDLEGNPITQEYLNDIIGKIRYVNQSMHGAMNAEDKGLIHQYILGRMTMNFRQWAVEHYSRRFRGRHFDYAVKDWREGYWVSLWKGLMNKDTKETWKYGQKQDAVWMFMKDFMTFMIRSSSQWKNLNEMQRANIKRVRSEMLVYISLLGLGFALGEPDKHKKEFWRRWWMYQTKRMILETEATLPLRPVKVINNTLTMVNSPMAGLTTMNSMMYVIYGLENGDLFTTIKSGKHKGENKYFRNVMKYTLPFFKDFERLQNMDEDDTLFKIFEQSPSKH